MPFRHLYVFFGKMSSQVFCPLLIVIYAGLYELFIYFGYELLISHVICKYFLPFRMLCFFMCVWGGGFLCCAKLVSLSRSHLLIFTLISFPLGQQSPTFLAPGTGFMEDSFSMGLKMGENCFRMNQAHYIYHACYF